MRAAILTVCLHAAVAIDIVESGKYFAEQHVGEAVGEDDEGHPGNQWQYHPQNGAAAVVQLPATCRVLHALCSCPFAFFVLFLLSICLRQRQNRLIRQERKRENCLVASIQ